MFELLFEGNPAFTPRPSVFLAPWGLSGPIVWQLSWLSLPGLERQKSSSSARAVARKRPSTMTRLATQRAGLPTRATRSAATGRASQPPGTRCIRSGRFSRLECRLRRTKLSSLTLSVPLSSREKRSLSSSLERWLAKPTSLRTSFNTLKGKPLGWKSFKLSLGLPICQFEIILLRRIPQEFSPFPQSCNFILG